MQHGFFSLSGPGAPTFIPGAGVASPTNKDLAESIAEKVAAKLKRPEAPQVSPRLLTVEQAATYLGRTKTAVQCMIADRALPVVRHDRRVFLDIRDLDSWVEEGKG